MERSQKDRQRNVLPEDPLEGMGDLSAIDPVENTIPEDPLADIVDFHMGQEDDQTSSVATPPSVEEPGMMELDETAPGLEAEVEQAPSLASPASMEEPGMLELVETAPGLEPEVEQAPSLAALASVEEPGILEMDEQIPELADVDSEAPALLLDELIDAIDQEVGSGFDHLDLLDQEQTLEPVRELAQFVTFSLAGTEYAVPIHNVTEIAYTPEVTALPNVPAWIEGVANLRGDLISLIDLRLFFGLEPTPMTDSTRMLVGRTTNEDLTVGLLVDRAQGIRYLPVDEIDRPTAGIESQIAPYLFGAYDDGQQLLVLLDLERVLNSPRLRQFETQAV